MSNKLVINENTKQFSLRFPESLYNEIQHLAAEAGIQPTVYIRMVVLQHLKEQKQKQA